MLAAVPVRADPLSAERLLHDAQVLVAIRGQRGWEIDRNEVELMLGPMLESYCRSDPDGRRMALQMAAAQRAALGGPLVEQLQVAQGDAEPVQEAVVAERVVLLLARAATASTADCPTVVRPHAPFLGRQTAADRTVLHVDAGGLVTLRNSDHGWNYGGGGSGRLMAGRGWSVQWMGMTGLEIGGAALLDQSRQASEQQAQIRLHLYLATPLVVRRTWQQWHLDFDMAPVTQFNSSFGVRGFGFRSGVLVVVSTPRVLNTIPWAGIGVSAEQMLFGEAGRLGEWTVRGGFRAGFDWDFGALKRDRAPWRVGPK